MKRVLFLIATVTLVFMLSSCAEFLAELLEGNSFNLRNRSSHVVTVFVDSGGTFSDKTLTLKPVEDTSVSVQSDHVDYTYAPSDLVETGVHYYPKSWSIQAYYFWDRGTARPF